MNFEKVKKVKHSKPFTVIDVIITAVIACVIGVTFWAVLRVPSKTVTVSTPNGEYRYDLDTDVVLELEHLTVHIAGGKVWVDGADCRDKTCERTGVISLAGQSIVCLPNGIVITIGGDGDLQWSLG